MSINVIDVGSQNKTNRRFDFNALH